MGVKRCSRVSGIMVLIEKPTPEKEHLLATVLKVNRDEPLPVESCRTKGFDVSAWR